MTLLCELRLRRLLRLRLLVLSLLLRLRHMMMMPLLCRRRGKHLQLRAPHHLWTPHPDVMTTLVLILLLPRSLVLLPHILMRSRLLLKGRTEQHWRWN